MPFLWNNLIPRTWGHLRVAAISQVPFHSQQQHNIIINWLTFNILGWPSFHSRACQVDDFNDRRVVLDKTPVDVPEEEEEKEDEDKREKEGGGGGGRERDGGREKESERGGEERGGERGRERGWGRKRWETDITWNRNPMLKHNQDGSCGCGNRGRGVFIFHFKPYLTASLGRNRGGRKEGQKM